MKHIIDALALLISLTVIFTLPIVGVVLLPYNSLLGGGLIVLSLGLSAVVFNDNCNK